MDAALFSAINAWHAPWADPILLGATWLGVGAMVWFGLALGALTSRRHRAAAVRAGLALGVVLGVNDLLVKPLVDRPRPFQVRTIAARVIQQPPPDTTSFPSGHTATAIAGALALARVWPSARWALGALAALVAVSRVYVGVHYPGDLVGGAVVGAALAWLVLAGRHPSTWSRPGPPPPGATYVP